MDHIEHYFKGAGKVLQKKIEEKVLVIEAIKEKTAILLEKKELTIKNKVIFLHVFGAKRSRILSQKQEILQLLLTKHNLVILELR